MDEIIMHGAESCQYQCMNDCLLTQRVTKKPRDLTAESPYTPSTTMRFFLTAVTLAPICDVSG